MMYITPFDDAEQYTFIGKELTFEEREGWVTLSYPQCPGLYLFACCQNGKLTPLYWGQAQNLADRLNEHISDPEEKSMWENCNRVYCLECPNAGDRDRKEEELIMWYPTPYNEQLNPIKSAQACAKKRRLKQSGLAPNVTQLREYKVTKESPCVRRLNDENTTDSSTVQEWAAQGG